ncbi:LysR family transcriptional regulator [Pseudobacteriovorax antillogorgiicola]|uniref:DNA-binding transcriptional regulator, LysR family n=1 Tax=Pseudobacteriovorax antillogorgiicola TaxID=1513793 RepID=A0A1Y6BJJ1_9BACT|nr:LysR family transcriptional regulator [Pseudobacteriovorax antillogorgiicola]TCS55322.1 DNA-binding transcriptional LysR family regulator [Pseudobacteriovorax antillogorgiicola]SMF14170.1 DNA-binding transcriptional regulator, LysR family [Pseudobacteriovorax antillogorgiicola]
MSLLTHLNLNYLRIFLVVFRTRSMTQAAKELHLTQSGVSQQIKSLEETLQITLFDRINRRIIPTSEAEILYNECSRRLDDLEAALRQISNQEKVLKGKVKIGFPPIFGNHTIVPIITEFGKDYPGVRFDLRNGLASEMIPLLLQGQLDFAFVDSFVTDSYLIQRPVAAENLELICHKNILEEYGPYRHSMEFYEKLPYVSYTESESILNSWFQANFNRTISEPNIRATVMDCNVAATLAVAEIGASIVPQDLAQNLLSHNKQISILSSQTKVTNNISVVHLKKRTMGAAAQQCYEWISESLTKM